MIADVLRSFVSERQDNWPSLIPLVEFAINDSASPLGMGYTPFFADRGQHPRRPLSAPADTSLPPATDGVVVARLMDHVTGEVRALLHESQALRKARMDPHRKDVQFSPGDEVLLDTAHTPLPSRDRLSPRWMGPFRVLAKTAPNTYRLAVPPAWRAFDEFNVERLRRYVRRRSIWAATRRSHPRRSGLTALWSMSSRRSCASASGRGDRSCWCGGRARTHRVTPGSRWRT